MKPLSISLVLFGLLALVRPAHQLDLPGAVLGIVILICAATTFWSTEYRASSKYSSASFRLRQSYSALPSRRAGRALARYLR